MPKKINKNEKNLKSRAFFGQDPWPDGISRVQAPHTDVLDSLGLSGAQKWPKMAKNGQKRLN